jgi:hypothetical protein
MTGLIERLKRRGGAQPEPPPTEALSPPADVEADGDAPTTVVAPADEPAPAPEATPAANGAAAIAPPEVPAGADPEAPKSPGSRERGRLRRRLRYLRKLRDLQYRDLGGLVFDMHRFGGSGDADAEARRSALVQAKVADLEVVDRELRALADTLGDRRPFQDLREAGIGGTCDNCGAIFASDARFCASCGAAVAASPEPPASEPAQDGAATAGAGGPPGDRVTVDVATDGGSSGDGAPGDARE